MSTLKKLFLITICLLLLFSLSACAEEKTTEPYTKSYAFQSFVIDPEAHTISGLGHTYHYEITGDTRVYRITVTYPDGSTYSKLSASGRAERSKDYGSYRYLPGEALLEMLQEEIPVFHERIIPIWALALVVAGMIAVCVPQVIWWMTVGLFLKNKEPGRNTLIVYRIGGLAVFLVGIVGICLV